MRVAPGRPMDRTRGMENSPDAFAADCTAVEARSHTASITVRRLDRSLQYMSDNWPEGVPSPDHTLRPPS